MTAVAEPRRGYLLTSSARRGFRSQPFRWTIAPAMLAWPSLMLFSFTGGAPQLCLSPRLGQVDGALGALRAEVSMLNPPQLILGWMLMLAAMMAPLLTPVVGYVSAKSFVDRRDRAAGLFVGGYTVVWLVAASAGCAL